LSAQNVLTYKSPFALARTTGGIDTADIDGDGDLDILYSGEPGNSVLGQTSLHLYKNDGAGNFTEVIQSSLSAVFTGDLKFADVDSDGDQDVLIAGFAFDFANGILNTSARLYLNDGTGNFTYKNGTPFIANQYCEIAFADVDSDNDLDVCIVGQLSSALYTNDGAGNFTLSTTFSTLNQGRVVFGDINGDNHLDLLIAGQNPSNDYVTELYTNNGSGTFTLVNSTPFTGVLGGDVIIRDIDGDNDNDVLVTGRIDNSGNGFTGIYWNDGAGNFTLDNNTTFTKTLRGVEVNTGSAAALIDDIDDDNDMDIIMSAYYPTLQDETRIYINDGTNNFYPMNNIWMPKNYIMHDVAYGDLDGDGIKDFITSGTGTGGHAFTEWWKNTHVTKANKAIDFNGTNTLVAQHLKVLNNTPLDTLPITVEFWAKIPTTDTDIGLIKKTDATKGGFDIYTTSGILHAKYNKDASNHVAIQSVAVVNDDAWHHFAFTVDNSNANLYIDGILIQTAAWTGTAGSSTTTENLIFGQGTNVYNGLLDEVRIWKTVRTISEIRQNMYGEFTKPTDETNLIANYTMDVYSDSLIMDVSQYHNRAAISSGSITLVDELVNYSSATSNTNTSVQNTNTTIGKFTFDDATANGNDPFDAPIQIVVAEVSGAPNVTTGITEPNTDNKYYVIQLFDGAGTYSVDVSIDCSFPNGSAVSLYRRDDHSTGVWTLLSTGTVVGGKAVFNNITSFSQLMLASTAALPVELLSFNASAKSKSIQLDWAVGIEDNLSHYEIERSTDGRDFENIGSVSAKDLSFYEFEDYDIAKNEVYYYRLKAIDFDGSFEYSNIVNITMKQWNNEAVKIFPNPVSDILNIEIEGENAYISLHDQTGRMIRNFQPTRNNLQINLSDLPNGMYYATITVDGLHTVKKLIKQ
jgi:hypothetical protein